MVGTFAADLPHGQFKEYDAEGNFVRDVSYVNGMKR